MKRLNITEEEKNKIIKMHLSEQVLGSKKTSSQSTSGDELTLPSSSIVKQLKNKGYLESPHPNLFQKKTYAGLASIEVYGDSMYSMCKGEKLKFGCQTGIDNCIDVAEILASIPCCTSKPR